MAFGGVRTWKKDSRHGLDFNDCRGSRSLLWIFRGDKGINPYHGPQEGFMQGYHDLRRKERDSYRAYRHGQPAEGACEQPAGPCGGGRYHEAAVSVGKGCGLCAVPIRGNQPRNSAGRVHRPDGDRAGGRQVQP